MEKTKAIGSMIRSFPIESLWFSTLFYIVNEDISLLLFLVDMDRL